MHDDQSNRRELEKHGIDRLQRPRSARQNFSWELVFVSVLARDQREVDA
jgi:hypothetical protein